MSDELQLLRARVERRDQTIALLRKRVAALENEAIDNMKEEEDDDDEEGDEDEVVPEAICDHEDGVYRCAECSWEVVEGICEVCGTVHQWDEEKDDAPLPADSLYTDITYDSDREQAPRGSTPLLDIGAFRPLPGYTYGQYEALLQRGATRLMIETFGLEYSHEHGIFAWADSTLFSEFSGPKMKEGDTWKIQLGRRFDLDDDDFDGSIFVEGILEEAILFPTGSGQHLVWETVLESPGTWVTRMSNRQHREPEHGTDDGENVDATDDDDDDDMDMDMDNEGQVNLHELYDQRLEVPFVDDGPVLLYPGYDTTEDHSSDDEMVTESDDIAMGEEIRASVPDGIYDPAVEEAENVQEGEAVEQPAEALAVGVDGVAPDFHPDEDDEDNKGDVTLGGEYDEVATLGSDSESSDSVDSDFDDEEQLSGDEGLLAHAQLLR